MYFIQDEIYIFSCRSGFMVFRVKNSRSVIRINININRISVAIVVAVYAHLILIISFDVHVVEAITIS